MYLCLFLSMCTGADYQVMADAVLRTWSYLARSEKLSVDDAKVCIMYCVLGMYCVQGMYNCALVFVHDFCKTSGKALLVIFQKYCI